MPLSQLGVPSSSRPIHIMYSFLRFHIRSPAQRDVAGSMFSSFFFSFFSFKKIEPARCHRARAMCLSKRGVAEVARSTWASLQIFPNVFNCQVQSQMIRLIEMVPLLQPRNLGATFWAKSA